MSLKTVYAINIVIEETLVDGLSQFIEIAACILA